MEYTDDLDSESRLASLLNPKSMENYLEAAGFTIPKLLIERYHPTIQVSAEDFHLPQNTHDIYEETSFFEFHQILSSLKSPKPVKSFIRFKLDFRTIWKGLELESC
jgi:hypothetical protein